MAGQTYSPCYNSLVRRDFRPILGVLQLQSQLFMLLNLNCYFSPLQSYVKIR